MPSFQGADTPQAKINSADMGPPPQKPLSLTNLLHSHDLPLDVNPNKGSFSNFAEAGVHHAGNSQQQKDNFSSKLDDRNLVQHGGFESHVMEVCLFNYFSYRREPKLRF